MKNFAVVATIKIELGDRAEYVSALQAHALRCSETEPGTLEFRILVPQDDPNTVMLYELYSSAEAFQAHLEGASIAQMRAETSRFKTNLSGIICEQAN
ncbi:antibiotic biosynthesis monooxygenase [Pseudomonas viridiflava]|uniref:putative quinol monooxygenase n=1 Tax=Pseudomonas viridiflava TaxID=33069 RepID=UPI00211D38EB|nr:antibiotic biosynthesis monooxygenase family protein [Pseudomonas viridiflava]MCQ9391427.1 antibiotic biosynthesis monooxygenase [Pseudomonas viridiflava]